MGDAPTHDPGSYQHGALLMTAICKHLPERTGHRATSICPLHSKFASTRIGPRVSFWHQRIGVASALPEVRYPARATVIA